MVGDGGRAESITAAPARAFSNPCCGRGRVQEGKQLNCAVCVINRQRGLKDEARLLSLLRLLSCSLFCMYIRVCMYLCMGFFQSTFALLIITLLPLAQAATTTEAAAGGAAIKGC